MEDKSSVHRPASQRPSDAEGMTIETRWFRFTASERALDALRRILAPLLALIAGIVQLIRWIWVR